MLISLLGGGWGLFVFKSLGVCSFPAMVHHVECDNIGILGSN